MLRLLVIAATAVNVMFGLGVALTRGAIFTQVGLPSPLPFYSNIFAVFLSAPDWRSFPPSAIRSPIASICGSSAPP